MSLNIDLQENLTELLVLFPMMVGLVALGVIVGTIFFSLIDLSTKIYQGESKVFMVLEAVLVIPACLAGFWGLNWLLVGHVPNPIAGVSHEQIYNFAEFLFFVILPVSWGIGSSVRWRNRSRFNYGLDPQEF